MGGDSDVAGPRGDVVGTRSELYANRGVSVLYYNYTGYGASDGECTEQGCYRDLRAMLDYAEQVLLWPRSKIVLVGQSLGSGLVFELLASGEAQGLAGAVLFHPYRSIVSTKTKRVRCAAPCAESL